MTAARTALQLAALAATQTMPRVVSAMARAAHGPKSGRLEHLRLAKHHVADLLGKFELVEIQLERELSTCSLTVEQLEEAGPS